MHLSQDGDGNLPEGEDPLAYLPPHERPVPVDSKGISPLTTSPRADYQNSKDGFDYHSVGHVDGALPYRVGGLPLAAKHGVIQNAREPADAPRAQTQSPRAQYADEHYGGTTNEQIYSQWGISQQPAE